MKSDLKKKWGHSHNPGLSKIKTLNCVKTDYEAQKVKFYITREEGKSLMEKYAMLFLSMWRHTDLD